MITQVCSWSLVVVDDPDFSALADKGSQTQSLSLIFQGS